jgi:3-hydroxyisobutyrate dehydrogenase-like beta-hydroxyacid dehydrogenase
MTTLGFIGLGAMGSRIAARLIRQRQPGLCNRPHRNQKLGP